MTSEKPAAPDTEGPYKVERVSGWWNVTGPDSWISSYHSLKRARHDAHRLNFGYRAGQQEQAAKDEARRARTRERIGNMFGAPIRWVPSDERETILKVLCIMDEESQ